MILDYEIVEYLERLHFESNAKERELSMAKKLSFQQEKMCELCKKMKISQMKFDIAKEELSKILENKGAKFSSWKLDYKTMEVTFDEQI